MRIACALSLVVLAAYFGPAVDARAQSVRRGPYYGRTTTTHGRAGMAVGRGVGSLEQTTAVSTANLDPLRPYSSHASGGYTSEPPVAPAPRPQPRPVARNFYPTARIGQSMNRNTGGGRPHCTPSRAGSLGR